METVLLFGGRSFIGGHVCRVLLRRGYNVLLHSRSSADFKNLQGILPDAAIEPVLCRFDQHDELRKLMDRCKFAIYAAIPYSKQSIGRGGRTNRELVEFDTTLNILAASEIIKSVFISVSGTVGRVAGGLADETRSPGRDTPKGWGHLSQKIASEQLISEQVRNGLQAVIVNPSMCVGEFDTKPSTGEFFRFFARFPFALMPSALLNIVDVQDVAEGTILALEKGIVGQRYILSGTNTTMGALIQRIRQLHGRSGTPVAIPRRVAILAAWLSEVLNLVVRGPAPIMPLLGVELIGQGSQHLTCGKAARELGFEPGDAWTAVDKSYRWYKENKML
jgi:dihydroflavonol-4-reductase